MKCITSSLIILSAILCSTQTGFAQRDAIPIGDGHVYYRPFFYLGSFLAVQHSGSFGEIPFLLPPDSTGASASVSQRGIAAQGISVGISGELLVYNEKNKPTSSILLCLGYQYSGKATLQNNVPATAYLLSDSNNTPQKIQYAAAHVTSFSLSCLQVMLLYRFDISSRIGILSGISPAYYMGRKAEQRIDYPFAFINTPAPMGWHYQGSSLINKDFSAEYFQKFAFPLCMGVQYRINSKRYNYTPFFLFHWYLTETSLQDTQHLYTVQVGMNLSFAL